MSRSAQSKRQACVRSTRKTPTDFVKQRLAFEAQFESTPLSPMIYF
jgi:hypothetical protein